MLMQHSFSWLRGAVQVQVDSYSLEQQFGGVVDTVCPVEILLWLQTLPGTVHDS